MRLFPAACLISAVFALPIPAGAHSPEDRAAPDSPRQHIEEATRDILRRFELLLQSIPQYEAPEILENGDIIIRRIHPNRNKPIPDPGTSPNRDNEDRTKT
ncbi:MAG: hypothetical protein OEY85_03075 [Rhodospirillales bacterium]|nr:hypothetical protein [Rhodospirillales bacterium]